LELRITNDELRNKKYGVIGVTFIYTGDLDDPAMQYFGKSCVEKNDE
jgi:hypothetical protein